MEVAPMIPDCKRSRLHSFGAVLLVAAIALWSGCATLHSSPPSSDALSKVTGTWTYKASGSQPLSEGTLQLATTDGRLTGQLRDAQLGTIPINANVSGQRLELRLDVFRIGPLSVAGSVQGDEFRGMVDRPVYDVSMSANEGSRSPSQDTMYGSFRAERRDAPAMPELLLNCPTLGPDGLRACR
jgi:hypothetical protein